MKYLLFCLITILLIACNQNQEKTMDDNELRKHAAELAQEMLIVDTHIDVPYRMKEEWEDISEATLTGDFDYPRAIQGGLNAPFMSIYIPATYQETGGGKAVADSLIDMVEGFVTHAPDKFAIAKSVADVESQFRKVISLPMGLENGAGIEDNLDNLKHFYDRGIRYVTLTHGKDNLICDSSYDSTRTHKGLSDFGKEVVLEMNKLGIMVDISHVSDDAFWQVMNVTDVPAIASHSSARNFTPGFERNMSDDMIIKLAEKGGVIQINFGSSFLTKAYRDQREKVRLEIEQLLKDNNVESGSEEAKKLIEAYQSEHPATYADVEDVADHIDHVVKIAGIDHVGIGSDYDGVGDSLPTGLKDVSSYPNLVYSLLKRGYSDEEVKKIFGGNIMRVWKAVEDARSNS